jgi:hypothetical protein
MASIFREKFFAILVFNGLLFGLVFYKDDITKAIEGVKAIAWYISAPVCEVNNFCRDIKNDQAGGTYISNNLVMDSFFYGKYTNLKTSSGDYVVRGDVKNHRAGANVIFKSTGNQLCVDTICYQVANNKI